MKILITGCNGMLGSDLCELLTCSNHEVFGLDNNIAKNKCNTCHNFIKCDITNSKDIDAGMLKIGPDIIIHTAAMTDVDGCEADPVKAHLINVTGTENIVSVAQKTGSLVILISTDYVFDGDKKLPYTEDDETNPINVYGHSKHGAEEAVKMLKDNYIIIRTSWLYGKCGKNFVDTVRKKALYDRSLNVVVDQYGSPTYTVDLARAIEKIIEKISNKEKLNGIFHITNSDNCSWFKFAEMIFNYSLYKDIKINPITSLELDRAAKRPKMSILENKRFNEIFYKMRPWQDALRDYITSTSK